MTSRLGTFLSCAALVLALDQLTKAIVSVHLIPGDPVPLLGQFVSASCP